jgi:nucleoside-diphosphate-sugar epimerase
MNCEVRQALAPDRDHILAHTQGLWEPLRGQKVFITGGTGFVGRWLLEGFAEANRELDLGAQAVVLTRHPETFQTQAAHLAADRAIRLIRGDVLNLEMGGLRQQPGTPREGRYSFVIHAAADTSLAGNRDQPLATLETLYEGTRRALEFAAQAGAQGFLFTSSGMVYGGQPGAMNHVPESCTSGPDIGSPLSAYGEGKRVAELLCAIYSHTRGLPCKVARGFAFVGPHLALNAHYAIGNFIRDALAGKPIGVNGDGTPLRSYLYGADLAVWLWTLLLHPKASGAYNVGSDEAHSIREIAECVSRNSGHALPVTVAQAPDPRRPAHRYVPDISRARNELGLRVWTSLDSAVRKTLEFHQDIPKTEL